MNSGERTYPRTMQLAGTELEVRYMQPSDEAAVSTFARAQPPHDLLFMRRDITAPKVMAAWLQGLENGSLTTLLAIKDGNVQGCAAIIRDELSWSPHVGEMRILLDRQFRGKGLGHALAQESFAIAVFEELGFHAEALLRDHVQDRNGTRHDVVLLSQDVNEYLTRMEVLGLSKMP